MTFYEAFDAYHALVEKRDRQMHEAQAMIYRLHEPAIEKARAEMRASWEAARAVAEGVRE